MGTGSWRERVEHTPIGVRVAAHGWREVFLGVTRTNAQSQVVAGVTLVAIAVPEQLATADLAGVPAFAALLAFIIASVLYAAVGSNPILSVGADSTIAPLFAVALGRLVLPQTPAYFTLVAMTAAVTGVMLVIVGLAKLGWIADFLSLPLVTGFLAGIGFIIVVHQLPHALGIAGGGVSVLARLQALGPQLSHSNVPSVLLAAGTFVVLMVGERVSARFPWALGAVLVGAIAVAAGQLTHHGVAVLGNVSAQLPHWRLSWIPLHQWSVVVTTSLTLVIVIMSQSAATARSSADDIGVADDISQDFLALGVANLAAGLAGAIPVNASPARTTVARVAGGRTKLVGVTAAVIAVAISPVIAIARFIPLPVLAGILFFVAARLIAFRQLRAIYLVSRVEAGLAVIATAGVVLLGVEVGLAIAVGLAIITQTWRSAHPHMIELGRRHGTTSWERFDAREVTHVDHLLVLLFDRELFFANSGIFRRELHAALQRHPKTRHVIFDAAAMSDLDFTALSMLSQVVTDLVRDGITVSMARVSPAVVDVIKRSSQPALSALKMYDTVDLAAQHALKHL
jgi:MFS superfamily sulfate permease-like transporter